jgi:hypothetical protein
MCSDAQERHFTVSTISIDREKEPTGPPFLGPLNPYLVDTADLPLVYLSEDSPPSGKVVRAESDEMCRELHY